MAQTFNSVSRRQILTLVLTTNVVGSFARAATTAVTTPYKYGKLVLGPSDNPGEYDSKAVDCPFVFRHRGKFYMTFVGFDGFGYQTGLASSEDLVHWTKEGVILKRDPSNPVLRYNIAMNWIVRENSMRSPGNLVRIDGQYVGAYHAYPGQGYENGSAVIGLCRSKDLLNWTVGDPVLRPEEGAPWERGGLYKPCLLRYKGTYYLFYNAKNNAEHSWNEQTGFATSPDLKNWTRYAGNPVLRNGPAGSLDEHFASDPCVLQNGNQWVFFYFGFDRKGVARDLVAVGEDFRHPIKYPDPVIDVGPSGSVDSVYAHKPSVVTYRGDLYHFYCAVSKPEGKELRGISLARSRPWA